MGPRCERGPGAFVDVAARVPQRAAGSESESEAPAAGEHVWQPSSRAAGRGRRAMVRACRALRVQIKGFEDDFRSAAYAQRLGGPCPTYPAVEARHSGPRRGADPGASPPPAPIARAGSRRACRARRARAGPVAGPPATRRGSGGEREAVASPGEKRHVKQQLKDYDAKFFKKHGRPRSEKEPIPPLRGVSLHRGRLARCGWCPGRARRPPWPRPAVAASSSQGAPGAAGPRTSRLAHALSSTAARSGATLARSSMAPGLPTDAPEPDEASDCEWSTIEEIRAWNAAAAADRTTTKAAPYSAPRRRDLLPWH